MTTTSDDGLIEVTGGVTVAEGTRFTPGPRSKRHTCALTADRLAEHARVYQDRLTPRELEYIDKISEALSAIAEGRR
jgi:hypothetical protein